MGKWDLLTNEMTKYRFTKRWNAWLDELNCSEETMELNENLGLIFFENTECMVLECDIPRFVPSSFQKAPQQTM